jgi:hypothetical protein
MYFETLSIIVISSAAGILASLLLLLIGVDLTRRGLVMA